MSDRESRDSKVLRGARKLRKMQSMSDAQNSAGNSAKRRRGNPTKIKPFHWPKVVSGNPVGRPRKKPLTELYVAFADLQVDELPLRIRKRLKDREGLPLAANGVLGLYLAMGEGSHSAAKELRQGVEGKLTEKIDLTIDVNRDVVERLQAARTRLANAERLQTKPRTAEDREVRKKLVEKFAA
jgi:hypothetical protein